MKKFGSVSLSLALISTVVVAGSGLFTLQKLAADAAVVDWQRGASIESQYPGDFDSDSFKQSVQQLKATGANSVSLILPYWQPLDTSSNIAPASNAPSDQTLINAINYIHGLGMQVMLKPHVEAGNQSWRAFINPTDRSSWYANYSAILNHLGDIAQQTHVEIICVGTELIDVATYTQNSSNTQQWINMINSLRTHYSGKLTYSANWGAPGTFADEKNHIAFWGSLDYIGINGYFNLVTPNTDYASLAAQWNNYRINDIEPLHSKYGKPILFTEAGYRSVTGAHNQPWDYSLQGPANQQEQANDYQAFLQYWNQYSYIAGMQIWQWSSNPNAGGPNDNNYTPQNKSALGIITNWFTGANSNPVPPTPTSTPTTTPPVNPPTPGNWNITAANQSVTVNQQVNIPITVSNTGSANDVVVDVEIYNQSGSMMLQKFFEHQNISSTASGQYTISWTPMVTGNYMIKAGMFSSNWQTNFYWNNNVATISVNTNSNPGGGTGTTTPPTNPVPPTPTSTPIQNPPSSGPNKTATPTATTLPATVSGTTATLSANFNMNGGNGHVWFEYGTNPTSTNYSVAWPFKAGVKGVNGTTDQNLTVILTGLQPHTTYYYRINAENESGALIKTVGNIVSFTTQ